jgi:hypothetical protein
MSDILLSIISSNADFNHFNFLTDTFKIQNVALPFFSLLLMYKTCFVLHCINVGFEILTAQCYLLGCDPV